MKDFPVEIAIEVMPVIALTLIVASLLLARPSPVVAALSRSDRGRLLVLVVALFSSPVLWMVSDQYTGFSVGLSFVAAVLLRVFMYRARTSSRRDEQNGNDWGSRSRREPWEP